MRLKGGTSMRRYTLAIVLLAAAAGVGCGDDHPAGVGGAGRGGGAGSIGVAGVGGGGGVAGTGGGSGAAGVQSAEEVHDGLINAQTTGGIEVTRPQPTVTLPACQ
jgi:hypothetical protein